MESKNPMHDQDLLSAWAQLNEEKDISTILNEDLIISSINSKSKLTIMEIKRKLKIEMAISSVMNLLLLCFFSYDFIFNSYGTSSLYLYIILVSIVLLSSFYTFKQLKTYRAVKLLMMDNSSLDLLKSTYESIKSFLKFDLKYSTIATAFIVYIYGSYVVHIGGHVTSFFWVLISCIILTILIYTITTFKNRQLYASELEQLGLTIEKLKATSE